MKDFHLEKYENVGSFKKANKKPNNTSVSHNNQ